MSPRCYNIAPGERILATLSHLIALQMDAFLAWTSGDQEAALGGGIGGPSWGPGALRG